MLITNAIPLFINADFTIKEASQFFLENKLESSQILDGDGNLLGTFSRSQLLEAMAKGLSLETRIKDIVGYDSETTPAFNELNSVNKEDIDRVQQEEALYFKLKNSEKCVIHSEKMQKLMKMVIHIAGVDSTVLIQGESGVGKELIADILYSSSNRSNGPFVKINCAAIPSNLLESELFGYEAGAFTGASKQGKLGLFEMANGGVLFLDEIGDMPLDLQAKLLRAIQEKEITRVGGTQRIQIDLRILAGTNRSLKQMVDTDRFRKDLYYRLNVVPIFVPPLRERPEDILALARHFIKVFNKKHHMNKIFTGDALKCFMSYDWPGNVRELENLIERLVVTTMHDTIDIPDLSAWSDLVKSWAETETELIPLQTALENTERKMLQKAFSVHNSTYAVARALGISQPSVVRKTAKYGIVRH